jgi:hypothetical protein
MPVLAIRTSKKTKGFAIMKKFIPLLTALVAFSPLAACSNDNGDTAKRLNAVEQDIAAIRQQLDEQETSAATPSTVVPASTTPVLEATTAATDSTLRTDEEVRQNSIEACEKYRDTADTYIASLDAPPGIFFHGICDGDSMWGFAYQGPETDIWYPNVGGRVLFDEEGHFEGDLAAWSGVPLDRHHPAFPDALTMVDMAALPEGSTVCYHLVEGHRSGFAIGEGLEFPGGGKITCCFLLALGKRPRIALGHAMQLDTEKRIIIAIAIFLTKLKECPVRFFSIDYMTINLVNLFQKS